MTTRRRAVVFGPVQPVFDPGFLDPITARLRAFGYAVEIVDSLAVLDDETTSIDEVAARWTRRRPDLVDADLLCGNAFGGAVVQALVPSLRPDAALMLLSSPSVTDRVLATRLGDVARHARMGNLAGALWILDDLVRSEAIPSPARTTEAFAGDRREAGRRLDRGMSLLTELDLAGPMTGHAGPVLSIVGRLSRLVRATHVRVPDHGVVAEIPDAGMRPHRDNAVAVDAVLTAHRRYLSGDTESIPVPTAANSTTAAICRITTMGAA